MNTGGGEWQPPLTASSGGLPEPCSCPHRGSFSITVAPPGHAAQSTLATEMLIEPGPEAEPKPEMRIRYWLPLVTGKVMADCRPQASSLQATCEAAPQLPVNAASAVSKPAKPQVVTVALPSCVA